MVFRDFRYLAGFGSTEIRPFAWHTFAVVHVRSGSACLIGPLLGVSAIILRVVSGKEEVMREIVSPFYLFRTGRVG